MSTSNHVGLESSSDEDSRPANKEQMRRSSPRSSERLRRKNSQTFQMPSRDEIWKDIPSTPSPAKSFSHLKPRKLVNDYTRVNHRYNHDRYYTDDEDSDLAGFIASDGEGLEEESESSNSGTSDAEEGGNSDGRIQVNSRDQRSASSSVGKKRRIQGYHRKIRHVASSSSSSSDESPAKKSNTKIAEEDSENEDRTFQSKHLSTGSDTGKHSNDANRLECENISSKDINTSTQVSPELCVENSSSQNITETVQKQGNTSGDSDEDNSKLNTSSRRRSIKCISDSESDTDNGVTNTKCSKQEHMDKEGSGESIKRTDVNTVESASNSECSDTSDSEADDSVDDEDDTSDDDDDADNLKSSRAKKQYKKQEKAKKERFEAFLEARKKSMAKKTLS